MTRKPSSERRDDIVEAALALLAEAAPGDVTTRDVAARVGISQPAIFKHFESRDALFAAVVDHVRDELGADVQSSLGDPNPLTALLLVCEKLFGYAEQRPGLPRLLVYDVSHGGTAFHDNLRSLVSMQGATVRLLLERAAAAGEVPPELDPELAATTLIALVQGMLLSWLHAGRKTRPLDLARPGLEQWVHAVRGGIPRKAATTEASDTSSSDVCDGVPRFPDHLEPTEGPREPLTRLDARPIIAAGGEPLTTILETLAATHPQGLLELLTPFEPRPLLQLVETQGAKATCERLGDKHFRVWIRASATTPLLDLRDLPAPEPLEQILAETARLEPGQARLAIVPRFPQLLLPHLAQRGLTHAELETDGGAILFVRRPAPSDP